jgi:hypothetical protein
MHRFIFGCVAAALFAASSAHAVFVNPDGVGQALIYPYFTAQTSGPNPYNTFVSLVNRNDVMRSVRVRIREGRNHREVLGFNLLLGARDSWTGAIIPTANGAQLVTEDKSCTAPAIGSAIALSAAGFTGVNDDGLGSDVSRLREGYIEVLEMASFVIAENRPAAPSCDAYRADNLTGILSRPRGELSGTLTLINVSNGMEFSVNAEALDDLASTPFHRPASDPYPDFNAAEIGTGAAFLFEGTVYRLTARTGLEAIEAVLTRGIVVNEYVLDAGSRSTTDWVFTFPTWRFHAGEPPTVGVGLSFSSREGRDIEPCSFPECPPGAGYNIPIGLAYGTSVMSIRRAPTASTVTAPSDVLGARNAVIVNMPLHSDNGSLAAELLGGAGPDTSVVRTRISDGTVVQQGTIKLFGAPVSGFMVRTFRNDFLRCGEITCQGNYGGAFPHKYVRQPYPDPLK